MQRVGDKVSSADAKVILVEARVGPVDAKVGSWTTRSQMLM